MKGARTEGSLFRALKQEGHLIDENQAAPIFVRETSGSEAAGGAACRV